MASISLVDSCGSLVAGNCEELEPVLVVKFCHVHQVRHFHAGFGQLGKECTDKLVQVKEPVFVMLRIPIIRSDVASQDARCPRQMTLQPVWQSVPPWWRAKVPAADEDELVGMAIDYHSRRDLAMYIIFHLGVPIFG